MSGFSKNQFVSHNFVAVRPDLAAKLGLVGAYISAHIHWRTEISSPRVHEEEGHVWWRITTEEFANEVGLSSPQVRRALTALTELGLVIIKQFRLDGSYDQTHSYRLNLEPEDDAPETQVNTDVTKSSHDLTKSSHRLPKSSHRVTESSDVDVTKSSDVPSIKTVKTLKTIDGVKTLDEVAVAFDKFYANYPRPVARRAAEKAFISALQRAPLADIARGTMAYRKAVAGQEERFVAHPTSWLNSDRWNDEHKGGAVAVEDLPKMRRLDGEPENFDQPPANLPPLGWQKANLQLPEKKE